MFLDKKILVTGGASFIGSHIVDQLVSRGAWVRVVDNLSSGKLENIEQHVVKKKIEFVKGDLLDSSVAQKAMQSIDIVFHLAADHGGRGYIDMHQVNCATNLLLDGQIFRFAAQAGVEKIIFASSGCVYPNALQTNPNEEVYLTENLVKPPYDADNLYGWAKLMGELTLQAYCRETNMKAVSCRYFTAYGPRCLENHAVMAMIARAFVRQTPYEVWGDGTQVRNWTYIDDIVEGTLLAAEKIDDGRAINVGTMERVQVLDAVKQILAYTDHRADINYLTNMPTGPLNRVADNTLAHQLLGWQPKTSFHDGLRKTVDWYFQNHEQQSVAGILADKLTEH